MHELSLALNILDVAAAAAERQGNPRVVSIHLRLGPLAGVVAEALSSAFELARTGHPLAAAQLVIEETQIEAFCPNCEAVRPVASIQQLLCSVCGTPTPDVVRGREMELVALEIES